MGHILQANQEPHLLQPDLRECRAHIILASPLLTIRQKRVKQKTYPDLDTFAADVNLIFNNAMQFNAEDSQIYEDAVLLKVSPDQTRVCHF